MTTTIAASPAIEAPMTPLARVQRVLHNHPTISSFSVLVLSVVAFTIINTRFLAATNLSIMLQQMAVIGTLALAETVVILTAGIDLSVGAAMILTQYVMAQLAVQSGVPGILALIFGILLGAAMGLINGVLVSRIRLPPFIVTLGTFSVFTAVGLLVSNGGTISVPAASALNASGDFINLGPFTLTTGVVIMIGCYAVVGFMLARTAWGRHVYAAGDDPEAARLAGIRTWQVILSVYVLAGFIIGIAAWLQIGRVGQATTNISSTLNLDAITAVVIGGTSLFGGRGTAIGTLFGALIVEVFQNGLILAGVQDEYQQLAEGLLVLLAVGLDQWIRKARA